jgi:hypothetical protein
MFLALMPARELGHVKIRCRVGLGPSGRVTNVHTVETPMCNLKPFGQLNESHVQCRYTRGLIRQL